MEKTELNNKMFKLLNKYHKTGGETNEIKSLIEQGADVNAVDEIKPSRATPLMYACGSYDYDKLLSNGNLELAKFLISKGADVNAVDIYQNSALSNSALNGNIEIAKLLIDNGANVNARDKHNATPLMITQFAIKERQQNAVQIAKLLIQKGADVNAIDNNGKTALDYQKDKVEQDKNNEMIEFLKDTNNNKLVKSIYDDFMLHRDGAYRNLILERINDCLANGANIHLAKDKFIDNYGKEQGEKTFKFTITTLLKTTFYKDTKNAILFHFIKENPDLKNIKECLDNGADINCVRDESYYTLNSATPLMMAIDCRYDGITEYLIEQGADVNIKNKEGETALMVAVKWEDLETAKLLIDKGANVNAKDKEGKTALDIAIEPIQARYIGNPINPPIRPPSDINIKISEELKNLIISKGGKRGIEIKPKVKAKAKTKQKSNDFEIGM